MSMLGSIRVQKEEQARIHGIAITGLSKAGLFKGKNILDVSIGPSRKQNWYSAREGRLLSIEYADSEIRRQLIWAKTLENPKEAFHAMASVYAAAAEHNIAGPIPKPLFFDQRENLLFMEAISGRSLLKLTIISSLSVNPFAKEALVELFFDIGQWLQKYHLATDTGESTNIHTLMDELYVGLRKTKGFNQLEKMRLFHILDRMVDNDIFQHPFPLVKPHNDFTLRNLFVKEGGGFHVIDWDAMVHPQFPQRALCWWDVTTLILNLQSMLKILPAITRKNIMIFCGSFLNGYFKDNTVAKRTIQKDFVQYFFFIFTMRYWLGIDSDRPIQEIYKQHMGWRYSIMLRKALLQGHADITNLINTNLSKI